MAAIAYLLPLFFASLALGRELLGIITDSQSDISALLNAQNAHRALHSAPPLTWDTSLAASAAAYAGKCVYQHSQPADRNNAGENLAAFYVSALHRRRGSSR